MGVRVNEELAAYGSYLFNIWEAGPPKRSFFELASALDVPVQQLRGVREGKLDAALIEKLANFFGPEDPAQFVEAARLWVRRELLRTIPPTPSRPVERLAERLVDHSYHGRLVELLTRDGTSYLDARRAARAVLAFQEGQMEVALPQAVEMARGLLGATGNSRVSGRAPAANYDSEEMLPKLKVSSRR